MSAHTPGPWEVEQNTTNALEIVAEEVCIATICSDEDDLAEGDCEERANARLIAAAQTMGLLLLSAWQHVSHGGPTRGELEAVLRMAGLLT